MCYALKTSFMKKNIQKRQKRKPFDFEAGESFELSGTEDETFNNSYYFSAHSERMSFYCRLGKRNTQTEVWFFFYDGKERYCLEQMLYLEEAPLQVTRCKDGWEISFFGVVCAEGVQKKVRFEGLFTSEAQPLDFFTHMPAIRTAKAMAAEKWSKNFFQEVQSNNQVHYEQFGSLQATFESEDGGISFSLPCVRDHSYGKRDWNYMNNHLWLMAVNDKAQFNFSMVSYPAMTILEVGNLSRMGEKTHFVLKADYDRNKIAGNSPETLDLKLQTDEKKIIFISVKKRDEVRYLFQGGEYCLIEGIADYEIDGEKFTGILEVGYNREKGRIFNGKEIGKLKV